MEKRLHCKLSEEAYAGLALLARQEGVSVTAIIESLGRFLSVYGADLDRIRGRSDEWVSLARQVDFERRSRGGAGAD